MFSGVLLAAVHDAVLGCVCRYWAYVHTYTMFTASALNVGTPSTYVNSAAVERDRLGCTAAACIASMEDMGF